MAFAQAVVGREAELERLREIVDAPEPPCVVFVEGEAGVGKTALLEAVVAEREALVLRARPTAAEAGKLVHGAPRPAPPGDRRLPRLPAPQRRALAAALLLEDADGPVDPRLVGIACSLVARRAAGSGAARDRRLAVARRRHARGPLVRAAATRAGGAKRSPRCAAARPTRRSRRWCGACRRGTRWSCRSRRSTPPRWASSCTSGPVSGCPPPAVTRLHERALGNPLMALELIRAPGAATATDVRRLLARRLAALSPDARAPPAGGREATAEPTVGAVQGAAGLEEALAAELLVRDGERLRFSHPLIAAVVEERTPPRNGVRSTPGSPPRRRTPSSGRAISPPPPRGRTRASPPRSRRRRRRPRRAAPRWRAPSWPSAPPC